MASNDGSQVLSQKGVREDSASCKGIFWKYSLNLKKLSKLFLYVSLFLLIISYNLAWGGFPWPYLCREITW